MADESPPNEPQETPPEPGPPPSEPQGGAGAEGPPPPPGGGGAAEGPPPPPPPGGVGPIPEHLSAAAATKDERTWGMLCHLLALAGLPFPVAGNIVGPLVIWLIKKEESGFVDFHGRQSMWFQVFVSIAVLALVILAFVTCGITAILATPLFIAALVYAVIGAIQVSNQRDFEYYWVGPWVRKSL